MEFSPIITEKPKNRNVSPGIEGHFEVTIAANPPPQVTWYRNGQALGPTANTGNPKYKFYYSSSGQTHTQGMIIVDVRKFDEGEYEVRAWNKLGQSSSSAVLTVKGKLWFTNFKILLLSIYFFLFPSFFIIFLSISFHLISLP